MIETLIDIAIAEKQPKNVIYWYDKRKPEELSWGWRLSGDDEIAEAVKEQYCAIQKIHNRGFFIWHTQGLRLIRGGRELAV